MPYLLTDNEGNTPLLEASQPRTALEKQNALENLKEKIKTGTFVMEKFSSDTTSPCLYGTLADGSLAQYEIVQIEESSDLAFELLRTTRSGFYLGMMKQTSRPEIETKCKALADEIFSALYHDLLKPPSQAIATLLNDFKYKNKALVDLFAKIKTHVIECYTPIDSPVQFIDALKQNKIKFKDVSPAEMIKELENIQEDIATTYSVLLTLCGTPETFIGYLNAINTTPIPIGYQSMLLYSEFENLPLYVWRKTGISVTLAHCQPRGVEKYQPLNLVTENSYTNFNLLINKIVTDNNSSSPYQWRLIKKRDILREINKYQHNLLHRAVRSAAMEILVPFLLNNLNFKSVVNEKDCFGKPALHRLIRYIGEFREKLITELKITPKQLIQNALFTIEQLIQAGADPYIKDSALESAMDRAKIFKSQFKSSENDEFDLHNWLVITYNNYINKNAAPVNNFQALISTSISELTLATRQQPATLAVSRIATPQTTSTLAPQRVATPQTTSTLAPQRMATPQTASTTTTTTTTTTTSTTSTTPTPLLTGKVNLTWKNKTTDKNKKRTASSKNKETNKADKPTKKKSTSKKKKTSSNSPDKEQSQTTRVPTPPSNTINPATFFQSNQLFNASQQGTSAVSISSTISSSSQNKSLVDQDNILDPPSAK